MNINNKIITAPTGASHLSDWMTELPVNCVLSKGVTGCGATTLAIEQQGNTIIAVPFVGLVANKAKQHPDTLLGVHGDVSNDEIASYIRSHERNKIIVTYDSVPRVMDMLQANGHSNVLRDFQIILDEWHVLFNAYDYRNDAIRRLLSIAPRFERLTCVSATPIERQYYLEELKHLPEVKISWPNAKQTRVRSHRVDRPVDYMAGICRNRVNNGNNETQSNYHIFLNSVEDIARIIRIAKLSLEQVKVVCSMSGDSARKNLAKLGGLPISTALDPVKTINLYTATCFEGQDIYDENGRTFVVSNGGRAHTLVDISTEFIQICGRIRNSGFNDEIVHLYSTTRYNEVTPDEFIAATEKSYEQAVASAGRINGLPEEDREGMTWRNKPYVRMENNTVIVDRNLVNWDIINYKVCNNIYKSQVNVRRELERNGIEVTDSGSYKAPAKLSDSTTAMQKVSFRDMFDTYCELQEKQQMYSLTPDYNIELIESMKPLVKEAYAKLGKGEVVRLNYHQSNIKRELLKRSGIGEQYKIVKAIDGAIPFHKALSKARVKTELQKIYDSLGITRKAKATDLDK